MTDYFFYVLLEKSKFLKRIFTVNVVYDGQLRTSFGGFRYGA